MCFNNIYKNKKVLITGHTGFKGSWLAIWLNELGAEVYGYALEPYSELDNFVTTGLYKKINHKIGDIKDINNLKKYFEIVRPDVAFHLAAQPLVLHSYQDPVGTFETNLMGTVNFFEAVRSTTSVKAAINVTSDKCYDNKEWVWGYRENDPMGGKDPYSSSKGCSELITNSYLHSYFKDSACNISSARAGNVIGGGDWAKDRIVPDFFRSVAEGRKIILRNPYATRPWQHVLEPLSGYLALGEQLLKDEKKFSGGWNFGPVESSNYNVKHLIDTVIKISNLGSYEIANLVQPHEANFLKLDITKAINQLNWQPALNFEQTIQFTVQGYINSNNSCYEERVEQISNYTKIAKSKNITWAV